MQLFSQSFTDLAPIAGEFAFGVPAASAHVALGANRNPHLGWSDVPEGTRSLVLICHDPDVPSRGDDVNQEGRSVPADLPRVDFFHWVLVDLAPDVREIPAGLFSDGITARGKPGPEAPLAARQGINDYTGWFAGDAQMGGDYYGYDGPCPPWNDALLHHYVFTLYAVDLPNCPVTGRFGGAEVRAALEGHILDQASLTGTYSLNPEVLALED